MPTPPAAPWTSSRSPTVSPACVKSASWAVVKTSGTPPAAVQSSSSGIGIAVRSCTTANSAWPPPATIAITRSPGSKRPTRRPHATTSPGQLEARDVGRRARRRGVVAGDLQHVGAVETGGADADEQLPVLGLGIGVLGDLYPAVADGGGAHARCTEGTPPIRAVVAIRTIGYKVDVGVPIPHFPPLWRESRAGVEAAALFRSSVWRGGGVPDGEGRPVLLIPGFLAGDGSLATMTHWLRENGY